MTGRKQTAAVPPPLPVRSTRHLPFSGLSRRRRVAAAAGALLVLALGTAALFAIDPAGARFFPRCPVFFLTGWKCPGCGTARALHATLHGRFAEAFRFNPALPALLALLAYALAFPRRARRPAFARAVFALLVAWGVLRNFLGA